MKNKTYQFNLKNKIKTCSGCPMSNYEGEFCGHLNDHVHNSDTPPENCPIELVVDN